jgi:signal transduction histidine kinase
MNLYSKKQRWKIGLLIMALSTIGVSLFVSNNMVSKIAEKEKNKAKQWASAIQKKVELLKFTNATFEQLREKERTKIDVVVRAQKTLLNPSALNANQDVAFAMEIINENNDIPVVLLSDEANLSQYKNIDTAIFRKKISKPTEKEYLKALADSIVQKAQAWKKKGRFFTINVFEDFNMTYLYDDSRALKSLEKSRDSLLVAFNRDLIDGSNLVPVLLLNSRKDSVIGSNIEVERLGNSQLKNTITQFGKHNTPIKIDLGAGDQNWLYFDKSPEVKQLIWFPYIQFGMIALIVIVGYLIFSTYRKAEQNQVWAGMAKETAHQLGTPLSSLMAWVQHLETTNADPMIAEEMQKDLVRLEKITDRFSKIGSGAKLVESDLVVTVGNNLEYLRARLSNQVLIKLILKDEQPIVISHNPVLIEWVIENICKNAVDAMEGKGTLLITLSMENKFVFIDIQDTGKGLTPAQFKSVFEPGFSSKKRGWGLGLTLVKRIVEENHKGKVVVLRSEINKGTTFRITLPL